MPYLPHLFLALSAVLLWRFVRDDRADYLAFKALTDSAARQRRYRVWIVRAAMAFTASGLLMLAVLGRLGNLVRMPAEFSPLADRLPDFEGLMSSGFVLGMASAFLVGSALALVLARVVRKPVTVGDIEPLLPRTGGERVWAAVLALNAGIGEELFFRLLLPLLLTLVTGDPLAAFMIAAAAFGLTHLYQGLAGVAGTTAVGALLSAVYLITGDLWIAALLHTVMNLNGLLLQPLLRRILGRPLPTHE